MFTLKSCVPPQNGSGIVATYEARLPGVKGAPDHVVDVVLTSDSAGAKATIAYEGSSAPNEDESFEALAVFLETSAKAIRSRGEPLTGVPIYN